MPPPTSSVPFCFAFSPSGAAINSDKFSIADHAIGFMPMSFDRFNSIEIDIDQLVFRQKIFNLRPNSGKKGVKLALSEIAKSKMNNSRRWSRQHDSIRKIRIFAHDHPFIHLGLLPDPNPIGLHRNLKNGR